MPSVPTFIRDENFDVWRALKDYKGGRTNGGGQAAWLNERLVEERERQKHQADRQISLTAPHLRPAPKPRPLDDVMELLNKDEPVIAPGCCSLPTPCKHWVFGDGVWKNVITNQTREVI